MASGWKYKFLAWLKENRIRIYIGALCAWVITCMGFVAFFNYKKDLSCQIEWGVCAVIAAICLFFCLLSRQIFSAKKAIVREILGDFNYERHVIKRLHDELIKKEKP